MEQGDDLHKNLIACKKKAEDDIKKLRSYVAAVDLLLSHYGIPVISHEHGKMVTGSNRRLKLRHLCLEALKDLKKASSKQIAGWIILNYPKTDDYTLYAKCATYLKRLHAGEVLNCEIINKIKFFSINPSNTKP